jgi:hypothetical protein
VWVLLQYHENPGRLRGKRAVFATNDGENCKNIGNFLRRCTGDLWFGGIGASENQWAVGLD